MAGSCGSEGAGDVTGISEQRLICNAALEALVALTMPLWQQWRQHLLAGVVAAVFGTVKFKKSTDVLASHGVVDRDSSL